MNIRNTSFSQTRDISLPFKRTLESLALFTLAFLLFISSHLTYAQTEMKVGLAGIMGDRAVITFNGGSAQTLKIGEKKQGVTLLSIQGQKATFLVPTLDGGSKNMTLVVGQSPMPIPTTEPKETKKNKTTQTTNNASTSVNKYCNPTYVVLNSTHNGMFRTSGFINGRSVQFLVDTGATSIAMSEAQARAIGITNYKEVGKKSRSHTANGAVATYLITLDSVRIGNIELKNIEASIGGDMDGILLGNTFLSKLSIEMTAKQMILRNICP